MTRRSYVGERLLGLIRRVSALGHGGGGPYQCQSHLDGLSDDSAIKLPTHLDALSVRELHDDRSEAAAELGSVERGQRIFSVTGNDYAGYVVAGSMFALEDGEDYAAPSALLVE